MSRLKKILNDIEDLPPMPDVALKLVKLTANMDSDIADIIELIEKDQSIAARVLKLCNSPYRGLSKKVASIQQAVVLLGFSALYKIVLTVATSDYFQKGANGYGLSTNDLWAHSVGTAIACETLAQKFDKERASSAYIAGLIHDIGKVLINEFAEEEVSKIIQLTKNGKTFIEAEMEVLGMDHQMIAGKLSRKWKFPEALTEAVKYHHEPHLAFSDPTLCALTHLGNAITCTIGIGIGIDSFKNKADEDVIEKYPLDSSELEEIVLITQQRVTEAEDFIREAMTA